MWKTCGNVRKYQNAFLMTIKAAMAQIEDLRELEDERMVKDTCKHLKNADQLTETTYFSEIQETFWTKKNREGRYRIDEAEHVQ